MNRKMRRAVFTAFFSLCSLAVLGVFCRRKQVMLALAVLIGELPVMAIDEYRSPEVIDVSIDGKSVLVTQRTAKQMAKVNIESEKIEKIFQLPDRPTGLVQSKDGKTVYVTCGEAEGFVSVVDLPSGSVKSFRAGHYPTAPVLNSDESKIYISNRLIDKVAVYDLKSQKVEQTIKVTREPIAAVLTKDGKFLFVANHLPDGRANVQRMTSHIDVISTADFKRVKSIELPNGAIDLREIAISNNGKWIFVPSIFARFLVPTNQIERGWINTHALNIIDVDKQELYHTVLLDDVDLGAANPWGVVMSEDDKYLFVAHNATHEVSVINFDGLMKKLAGVPVRQPGQSLDDYEVMEKNPANDLSFLTGLRQRVRLEGIGPRGVAVKGAKVFVAQYFSDDLGVVDFEVPDDCFAYSISLGPKKKMDIVRTGEMYFHDASICFQQWQTCSTCHPDARTDAVNWDLLNDGIGNPKSTKSMLFSHYTPPAMITGIRARAEVAVRAGIRHIQFSVPHESRAKPIDAYLRSLRPIPSPYLINGQLSKKAEKGREIFEKASCLYCHSGPYFSGHNKGDEKKLDKKYPLYDVGIADGMEKDKKFDTPTLVELYRTRPYLYDGRAANLHEVFTKFNKEDKHGVTSNLTKEELDCLVEYLNSL